MLTLTSEYALQALVFVARHHGEDLLSGREIADHTGIPANYLSSVLRELVRCGVLESTRGRGGGFRLARPARRIKLYDALRPFEPVLAARRPCPFGNAVCSDDDPCLGHDRWKKVREAYDRFLSDTSLHDVAFESRGSGRRRSK